MNPPVVDEAFDKSRERELARVLDRAARRAKVRAVSAVCRERREREFERRGFVAAI